MTPGLSYMFKFKSRGEMAVFEGFVIKHEMAFRTVMANTSNKIINRFIWKLFEKINKLS